MSRDIFGFKRNPQRNFLPDKPKRSFPRVRQTIPRDALAQAVNPAPSRRRFFGFTDDPDAPVSQPYIVSGAAFAAQSGSSAGCGCNHPLANNYDPSATLNNGSCIFNFGCTLEQASNYDPSALLEDGSCTGDIPSISSYLTYIAEQNQEIYAQYGVTYGGDEVCFMGGSLGDQAEAAEQESSEQDIAFDEGGVGGLLTNLANQPDVPAPTSGGSNIGSGSSSLASSALQGASKGRKRKPKRKFSRMSGRDECGFVNACGCA